MLFMKRITNYLLSTLMLAVVFTSCKKEENQIFYEGGTAPTLTANKTASIAVAFANADMEAVKFSWTNPNYKFSTGLSSQDVFYKLEIDTTNAAGTANPNFTFSGKQTIGVSKDLSVSITQGQLNDYLLNQLQLVPGMVHYLQIRLIANLVNSNATLMSNVIKLSTTPYAIPPKVDPPTSGNLFIVGNATPGDWNNPVPVPSQQFTKVSTTLFQINSLPLVGGNFYLLLPVNGDWSTKYGAIGANGSNNPDSDDFRIGGGDLVAPAASGNYKIVIDFQRGKYILTKL
jgi:hypothetical protein